MPDSGVASWPADHVERRAVASLIPYARNARKHSDSQVAEIAGSIREWGWTIPVLIAEDDRIIAGHGRVMAAHKLGIADVPVMVARGWTEAQKQAYTLADNQIALHGTWDPELLKVELADLREQAIDLATLGFSDDDVSRIIGPKPGLTDPDDVPEAPSEPITRPGDVWLLGRHRLVCGDATNAQTVATVCNGQRIGMVLTDPPYCSGGFQEAGKAIGSVGTRGTEMVTNDTLSTRGYMALMKATLPSFGAGVVYVFTDWRMWINLFDVVESSGYGVRNMIVWDKGTPGMGSGWRMQHELIMCGIKVKSPFNPKKAQGNVIQAKRTGNKLHAVEKPAQLLCEIMQVTDMAQTVADPFVGSGTTIIAAEMTGRVCHAIEISPAYCDVAMLRWQAFTGQQATKETNGRPKAKANRAA